MKDVLIEKAVKGVLEFLRVIAIALVSWLLTDGVIDFVLMKSGYTMDAATKVIVTGAITGVLKGVDKWLHEVGKATKNLSLIKGLVRF